MSIRTALRRECLEEFGGAYQNVIFAPRCLRIYRYVLGEINQRPELGAAFTQLVTDHVVTLVSPLIARATTADAGRSAELADGFLGALQGMEFDRALAGSPVDRRLLEALRAQALATLPLR